MVFLKKSILNVLKKNKFFPIHTLIEELKKLRHYLVIDHSGTVHSYTAVGRVKHLRVSGSHCSRTIVNFTAIFCQ